MGAQEDQETLTEILGRAGYTEEEIDLNVDEIMKRLGYKLKKLFTDDESQSSSGPRLIGGRAPSGQGQRKASGSQYTS